MLTPKNITNKQIKTLLSLLKEWTALEVAARLGPFPLCGDYNSKRIRKEDEIRELLFGSSDMTELGYAWKIFERLENVQKIKNRKRIKRNFRKLQ
jgi:hypothetical protein